MSLASSITRFVDFFYVKPIRKVVPPQTFRYIVCGGLNMLLGWLIYYLVYDFVVDDRWLNLGFVMMSPHVQTLFIQFPVTFFVGFWLNRYVTFTLSPLSGRTQVFRYVLQNAGSLLGNYLLLKLFVELCHIYPPVAEIIVSVIIALYSYLVARFFTFRE